MAFDPSKPFDVVDAPTGFDASKPFEVVSGHAPEEPSRLEASLRGAAQGITLGFEDELVAAVDAAAGKVMGEGDYIDLYRKRRDEERAANLAAQRAHPGFYGVSEFGGGLASMAVPGLGALGAGKGVLGAAAGGARIGALAGLGASTADITKGQVAPAIEDVGKGMAVGGVLGGALGGASEAVSSRMAAKASKQALEEQAIKEASEKELAKQALERQRVRIPEEAEEVAKFVRTKAGKELGEAVSKAEESGATASESVKYLNKTRDQLQKLLERTEDPKKRDQIGILLDKIDEHLFGVKQELEVPTMEVGTKTEKLSIPTLQTIEKPTTLEIPTIEPQETGMEKLYQKVAKKQAEGAVLGEPESTLATSPEQAAYASPEEQGLLISKGLVEGTGGQLKLPTTPQISTTETPYGKVGTLFEPESGKVSSTMLKPETVEGLQKAKVAIPTEVESLQQAKVQVPELFPGRTQKVTLRPGGALAEAGEEAGVADVQKAKQELGNVIFGKGSAITDPEVKSIATELFKNISQDVEKGVEGYSTLNASVTAATKLPKYISKLSSALRPGGDEAAKEKFLEEFTTLLKTADPDVGANWEAMLGDIRTKLKDAATKPEQSNQVVDVMKTLAKKAMLSVIPQTAKKAIVGASAALSAAERVAPYAERYTPSAIKAAVTRPALATAAAEKLVTPSADQMYDYSKRATDPTLSRVLAEGAKKDQVGRNAIMFSLSQNPEFRQQLRIMGAPFVGEKKDNE